MKRKILVVVTVTVVSLLVAAVLVYSQISEMQNQVSELQNKNNVLQDGLDEKYGDSPVHITSANMTGFAPIAGLTISSQVSITVENDGVTDISGLTLTVRLLNNNTEVGDGYVKQINGLRAGEIREVSGAVFYGIDSVFVIESTVKLGGVVLDENVISR